MRHFSRFSLLLLAGLALPAMASAQEGADAEGARVRESLGCLIGTWSGSGTVRMGEDEHDVRLSYTCEAAAAGAGVRCHLVMNGIPGFTYEANDLWGYDPGTGKVHWFTVTNAGETHDHSGRIDARSFVASFVGRREGQPMRENINFSFENERSLSFSSTVFVAHSRVESFTGRMTKELARSAQASRR